MQVVMGIQSMFPAEAVALALSLSRKLISSPELSTQSLLEPQGKNRWLTVTVAVEVQPHFLMAHRSLYPQRADMAAKMLVVAGKGMAPVVSGATTTELTLESMVAVVAHLILRETLNSTKAVLAVNMVVAAVAPLWLNTLTVTQQLIMAAKEGNLAEKAETRMALVSPGPLLPRIYSNFTP